MCGDDKEQVVVVMRMLLIMHDGRLVVVFCHHRTKGRRCGTECLIVSQHSGTNSERTCHPRPMSLPLAAHEVGFVSSTAPRLRAL